MLNKTRDNSLKIPILLVLAFALVAIRAFEVQLFYDPFLLYFEKDFNALPLPFYNPFQLFLGLLFRYGLNSVLSLGVIYIVFNEVEMVRFTAFLYFVFFLILVIFFFLILYFYGNQNNLFLFYIRRFLIQPIFVILFVPAFYYQKLIKWFLCLFKALLFWVIKSNEGF